MKRVVCIFFAIISAINCQGHDPRFGPPPRPAGPPPRRPVQPPHFAPEELDSFPQNLPQSDPFPRRDAPPPTYRRWDGPLHIPVISSFGVPTEPPEVEEERYLQIAALKEAYATAEPERDYDKKWDGVEENERVSNANSNVQFGRSDYQQPQQSYQPKRPQQTYQPQQSYQPQQPQQTYQPQQPQQTYQPQQTFQPKPSQFDQFDRQPSGFSKSSPVPSKHSFFQQDSQFAGPGF